MEQDTSYVSQDGSLLIMIGRIFNLQRVIVESAKKIRILIVSLFDCISASRSVRKSVLYLFIHCQDNVCENGVVKMSGHCQDHIENQALIVQL